MKILVAIDGSECSVRAVEFAASLASMTGSTMGILNVIPHVKTTKEDLIILMKEELGTPEKAGKKYLDHARELSEKAGVTPELILKEGNPPDIIIEESAAYDLLVVGSHGKGAFDEILLGSISRKIVHRATIPVTVVK